MPCKIKLYKQVLINIILYMITIGTYNLGLTLQDLMIWINAEETM